MAVLEDIYISPDEDAAKYDANPKSTALERLQCKGITPLELSTLWAILRGITWEVESMDEFQCVLEKNGGALLIHRLPPALIADLAKLEVDHIATAASKWASTDEMGWAPNDARKLIADLVRLAQEAIRRSQGVYLWNCL